MVIAAELAVDQTTRLRKDNVTVAAPHQVEPDSILGPRGLNYYAVKCLKAVWESAYDAMCGRGLTLAERGLQERCFKTRRMLRFRVKTAITWSGTVSGRYTIVELGRWLHCEATCAAILEIDWLRFRYRSRHKTNVKISPMASGVSVDLIV